MGRLEKLFVNSPSHSRAVAGRLERLLGRVPLEPGARYLDVGCGNGAATIRVARTYGLVAVGVDIDPEQIEAARERAGGADVAFITADACRLPFESGAFDIVATSNATHHIPDWESALRELIRVLESGGHLVYADFVTPAPVAALAERLAPSRARRTRRAVEALFGEHGLTVLHSAGSPARVELVLRKR